MIARADRAMVRHLVAALKDRAGYERLRDRIGEEIASLNQGLNAGIIDADEWQRQVAELLLVGHIGAAQEGYGSRDLPEVIRDQVIGIAASQIDRLNLFADQIAADGWREAWASRVQMYVSAMGASYEAGTTDRLELPAYPRDGSTQCLSNCKCRWRIVWVNRERLSADCYWEMGRAEHCKDCEKRARNWSPLRIRRGIVQR